MSHNSPFRFFDLPRELRDVIYDLLIFPTKTISEGVDENDTRSVITDVPIPALLRVNRQLNAEYSDLLAKFRTLQVLGGHCTYWSGYPDICGSLARSVNECYIYIHVECYCDNMSDEELEERETTGVECDAVDFLHNYREALQPFLSQLSYLKSVHLRIGVWGAEDALDSASDFTKASGSRPLVTNHSQGFVEALSMLVALPLEIDDLEIVICTSEEDYDKYRMEEDHGLPTSATWSRTGGWCRGNLLSVDG